MVQRQQGVTPWQDDMCMSPETSVPPSTKGLMVDISRLPSSTNSGEVSSPTNSSVHGNNRCADT